MKFTVLEVTILTHLVMGPEVLMWLVIANMKYQETSIT